MTAFGSGYITSRHDNIVHWRVLFNTGYEIPLSAMIDRSFAQDQVLEQLAQLRLSAEQLHHLAADPHVPWLPDAFTMVALEDPTRPLSQRLARLVSITTPFDNRMTYEFEVISHDVRMRPTVSRPIRIERAANHVQRHLRSVYESLRLDLSNRFVDGLDIEILLPDARLEPRAEPRETAFARGIEEARRSMRTGRNTFETPEQQAIRLAAPRPAPPPRDPIVVATATALERAERGFLDGALRAMNEREARFQREVLDSLFTASAPPTDAVVTRVPGGIDVTVRSAPAPATPPPRSSGSSGVEVADLPYEHREMLRRWTFNYAEAQGIAVDVLTKKYRCFPNFETREVVLTTLDGAEAYRGTMPALPEEGRPIELDLDRVSPAPAPDDLPPPLPIELD